MQGAQAPPSGTVALLFTDIEGSTQLARDLGPQWGSVLRRHREIVGQAITGHGGWVDSVEGDGFFATFSDVSAAAGAAVAAQQALQAEPWPGGVGQVRVRMGLHVGWLERTETGYVGLEIHRAARVGAAAHGGQVLLTEAARHLVGDWLPVDDLGLHRLKDFPAPAHLFCALIDGRGAADFPPPRTSGPVRPGSGRLPSPRTTLVGRVAELDEVARMLEHHQLVTLTGPGGVGKTSLALAVAAREPAGGAQRAACFVDASPLEDSSLLADRLARAMGLRPSPRTPVLEAVASAIAEGSLLVVLDNLEHLDDAAEVVGSLLGVGSRLQILATSRRPLHVHGEHVYTVPPLAVPGRGAAPSDEVPPSVLLFAERAVAADPAFRLTDETRPVVGEICRQLDGLPLAIELAADWMRTLPPVDLLARLNRRLDLLAEPAGDRPTRQRALRTTIDWSYQLLDEAARKTFRALALFRGGWSLAGAAAVCHEPDEIALLGQLAALTEASLIQRGGEVADTVRYRMLESLREFALEQLNQHDEADACRDRLAQFVYALAMEKPPHLIGAEDVGHLDRLEADRDTVNAVLRWLIETGQTSRGLEIASLLWRFWHLRGHLQEGREHLEALLDQAEATTNPAVHANGFAALANLAYWQFDYVGARQFYRSALALHRDSGSQVGVAQSLHNLAFPSLFDGDHEGARDYFSAALAVFDELDEALGRANAVAGLALVDRVTGDLPNALLRIEEAMAEQRALGAEFDATNSLTLLGSIRSCMGQWDQAVLCLRESLADHEHAGNMSGIAWTLQELAAVAVKTGEPTHALLLSAAASKLEGSLRGGANTSIFELTDAIPHARAQLPPEIADAAWREGLGMSVAEAVAAAMSDADDPGSNPQDSIVVALPILSIRERELLTLLARGSTDAEIAQQLFISIRTVRSHLDRIRDKTGCRRRADLTRLALDAKLV